jgi:cell division protein FtsZ
MAVGRADGDDRARRAAEDAISSGLLDVTIDGARGILFNITGGTDLSLFEVNEAAAIIKESSHPDVNLIFGAQVDDSMGDEVRITVIATGFEQSRVARKIEGQGAIRQPAPRQSVMQPRQNPAQPANLPPEQPKAVEQPPAQPTQAPPAQPQQPAPPPFPQQGEVPPRVYEENDVEMPAFLRKRR